MLIKQESVFLYLISFCQLVAKECVMLGLFKSLLCLCIFIVVVCCYVFMYIFYTQSIYLLICISFQI